MFALNLPTFDAKIVERDGKNYIFDILRRRYITLTPEEWVRQHFIHYLLGEKKYPQALLGNEISLSLNGTTKRCDSVLFRQDMSARMIMEYKAQTVKITQKVFEQITRYNIVLKVDYLIVSNGMEHFCCKVDYKNQQCQFLKDIPCYDELV
jgi:predicted type IV restriction endonuclease